MDIHKVLVILLSVFVVSHAQADGRELLPRTDYMPATNISNQQITSFAEDRFGHVWIGTFRGLNKYNATEYHQYFNSADTTTLNDNQVRSLLCDSKGRFWVGTVYGVCRYTDQDSFERIACETELSYTYQILENRNGHIFINTGTEIGIYQPEENKFVTAIPALNDRNTHILRCFIDGENNLWVINCQRIRCFNSTTFELKLDIDNEERFSHYAYMRDNGELWMASGHSLYIFDTRSGTFSDVPEQIKRHPQLSGALVQHIHPYGANTLLITTNEGMFTYNYSNGKVVNQDEPGFPFKAPARQDNHHVHRLAEEPLGGYLRPGIYHLLPRPGTLQQQLLPVHPNPKPLGHLVAKRQIQQPVAHDLQRRIIQA